MIILYKKSAPLNLRTFFYLCCYLMLKRFFLTLLCILMGVLFVFSGYAKLNPIEPFEYTFVDLGFINWKMAPFIARLMIGIEFVIGTLLLLNLNLHKITYKLGMGILIFFSVYLILLMAIAGNKGNCGCFGSVVTMTPLQALIKNSILLAVFFLLYKYHKGWEFNKKYTYLIIILCAMAVLFPFVNNPVELNYSEAYLNQPENNFKIELDSLYNNAKLNTPPKTLSQGKQIIVFMSLTCPHCRIAAKKIRIIHERNPTIPFYFVLNGEEENLKPFFEDTHAETISHCILNGKNFVSLAGVKMPRIYLVNTSIVEHDVNYIELDQEELETWLKK